MFATMEAVRVEELHLASDPQTGLQAIVAIHNTNLGPALGGCRYLSYPDEQSAVRDAARLARGMSYKAALAGLAQGGGKAVIIRPPQPVSREALFEAFGRFVDKLGGRYITAVDSGTSGADMDCIARHTGHVTSTTQGGDPSPHTALGVLAGIRATARARLGSDNLEGLSIAVQGLGHVGFALAGHLAAAGVRLIVSDIDEGRLELAVEHFGAQPVVADALLTMPCDILSPCGLGGAINPQTIGKLRCAAVAGAANNQLESPEMGDQLAARGILYAPDYVINSGGLIFVALQHQGHSQAETTAHPAQSESRLEQRSQEAWAAQRSPARVADSLAERLIYGS
jgi:leucine dehydrogenase